MDSKSHALRSSEDETRTPEEIRAEIDATRAALDRTVTEIEHRLQPRHLFDEAKAAAADGVRRAGESAKDAARSAAEQTVALGYRTADRVRQSPGTAIGVLIGAVAAVFLSTRGVQRLRRRRRLVHRLASAQLPASRMADASTLPRRRPLRRGWRRSTMWGAAAAALGACGTYAARRRT
jgi:ElaB/YqjD/DUF883 family membrane-anchored ribosome-binding protein